MRTKLLTLAWISLLGACATTTVNDGGDVERQPLGKADNIGSCQTEEGNVCGGQSDGTCWCDDACEIFGDCCGDKVAVCDEDRPIDDATLCLSDVHCGDGQVCDHTECHSNCAPGFACPAVCWGECVDVDIDPDPDKCGDGTNALCAVVPPVCPPGQFAPVINHCYGPCVDTDECFDVDPDPDFPCTDGTFPLCEILPAECPAGLVHSVVNNCFGPCVDPQTCEPPAVRTCEEIVDDFQAETVSIRSCTEDAECGQVLSGTSCGCTRNWVARADADTSDWEALRDEAFDQLCSIPGGISTCDCPFADGFACEQGICTWNYL